MLSMDIVIFTTTLMLTIGQTLGVGASTFALIFYIVALQDNVIDTSEKRFMKVVYVVLRIGMILITLALLGRLFASISFGPIEAMQWLLLGVITVNAVLMSMHKMPMRFGPVLAGGSWYSLFLLSSLPFQTTSFGILALLYVAFLIFFQIVFTILKNKFR